MIASHLQSILSLFCFLACPVTSLRRNGETSSMSSSRNSARCCRATPGRWTSPPSCRKALTSCVNTKVRVFYHPHLASCVYVAHLTGWTLLVLYLAALGACLPSSLKPVGLIFYYTFYYTRSLCVIVMCCSSIQYNSATVLIWLKTIACLNPGFDLRPEYQASLLAKYVITAHKLLLLVILPLFAGRDN